MRAQWPDTDHTRDLSRCGTSWLLLPALALAVMSGGMRQAHAQDPNAAQLTVAKIEYLPSPQSGKSASLRVTVANAAGRNPTPPTEPLLVKVVVASPSGRNATYETTIRASISGGGTQTGIVSVTPIYMNEVGTHTLTASASVATGVGGAAIRAPDKVEKILIGSPAR